MTMREIIKRHGTVRAAPRMTAITVGLVALGMTATTMPAAAQEEQLPPGIVIDVTPQSWLNPPSVPIEGSLPGSTQRQVIVDTYIARDSAFVARPDSFGESVLPRSRGPNLNLRTID
jgi:hypothetical protein